MLIIVSGPSGSGKNTVITAMIEKIYNLEMFKSCTTREQRPGEENQHYYLTEEEFEKKRLNDEFFECEMVHEGLWYGVLKKSIDDVIKGEKHYIRDVDVNGADKIASFLVGKANVIKIFVDAPNEVLKDRLMKRGESEEAADKRIARAEYERTFKNKYDLVITNVDFEATKRIVHKYLEERKNIII